MNIIIATIKKWNIDNANKFLSVFKFEHNIRIITNVNDLNDEKILSINPKYIFFPHWSYIIPKSIYEKYNCVVFHMTDLPYGRGGSPLQNLIIRGHKNTKISAIKVIDGIDKGPIYFKENLSLEGTAQEIFERCSDIIFNKMIPKFFLKKIIPVKQNGKVVNFKRRKPEDSELPYNLSPEEEYDFIRMLDADGYPHAFRKENKYIYEYTNARLVDGKCISDKLKKEI